MKKRIVLVTWKGGENFGTCLQGYALQTKLETLGYRVGLLPDVPQAKGLKSWLQWLFSLVGLMQLRIWLKSPHDYQTNKRRRWERKAYRTKTLWTQGQLQRLVRKTDCFVTGSDQIWNTYHHFMPMQFLNFAADKKRVAYASSIGTSRFKPEYESQIREWLMKFQHIGVREQEAVRIIEELTGRQDVVQVLDPTFLLSAEDWREFAKGAKVEIEVPKHYVFCYLLGQNPWYVEQLKDVSRRLNLPLLIIPACENKSFEIDGACVYRSATAPEFVKLLAEADFVCTDSFHATAFSINLQKPFVEFMRFKDGDEKSQNSRIYDLLAHCGLWNRIYDKDVDDWLRPVAYESISVLLKDDRDVSTRFLVNSIER